ncbi:MAG: NADPH-dependent oxidoreductase [Chloroflexota bacterium]
MSAPFDNAVTTLMQQHRSIRQYRPDPLPEGMLEAIVASAQMASTSSYLQYYSVIAVQDPARKERLAALCGDQAHIRQCPVFLAFCADAYRLRRACALEGKQLQTDYLEAFLVATVDTALLAQNVALAAESLGLGIVYIGAIRNNTAQVIAELELPELVFPITGLCLGYPAEDPALKPRLPLPAVLHRERYHTGDTDAHLAAYDQTILAEQVFRSAETGELYTWTSRAARRASYTDPKQLRIEMGQVVRDQGFGLL